MATAFTCRTASADRKIQFHFDYGTAGELSSWQRHWRTRVLRKFESRHFREWLRPLPAGQLPPDSAAHRELRFALGLLWRGQGEEQLVHQFRPSYRRSAASRHFRTQPVV